MQFSDGLAYFHEHLRKLPVVRGLDDSLEKVQNFVVLLKGHVDLVAEFLLQANLVEDLLEAKKSLDVEMEPLLEGTL